jgi:hypothetical protein
MASRGGERVPLSEEEQRILQEMEQKLYADDRAFVTRVRAEASRSLASRPLRWSVLAFVAGLAVLLASFRSSLLLGTLGFLVMVVAALAFERSARQAFGPADGAARGRRTRSGDLLASLATRLRGRRGR